MEGEVETLDRASRFVDAPEALSRGNSLDRNPTKVPAKLDEHLVLEQVQRREIDVAALSLDHFIMISLAQERCDAEAGSRPDDRGHALCRERHVRPAQVHE